MSDELYGFAVEGDIDGLCESVEAADGEHDPEAAVYQWLQVAASLGSEQAEGMAEDLYEGALSRGGDETVAVLHYEVALWFIRGENGVAPNPDLGLDQLERAEQLRLRESVDLDGELRELRAELTEEQQRRFDRIFPGLLSGA